MWAKAPKKSVDISSVMFPVTGPLLKSLIPQKEPFVLIDSLDEVNGNVCVTSFSFMPNHVLCAGNKLSAAGLLENMAQSAGCKLGYEDFAQGKKHTVGFIGEVRDFSFTRLPEAGEKLTTEIIVENKVFGTVTVLSGSIKINDETIASCRMKVFFQPDEK